MSKPFQPTRPTEPIKPKYTEGGCFFLSILILATIIYFVFSFGTKIKDLSIVILCTIVLGGLILFLYKTSRWDYASDKESYPQRVEEYKEKLRIFEEEFEQYKIKLKEFENTQNKKTTNGHPINQKYNSGYYEDDLPF